MATMPGLRPLAFGEILDVGIKLCLRNWRVLVMCVLWLVLPAQILSVTVLLSVAPDALDPTTTQTVEPGEETRFFVAQGISGLVQGLVYLVSTAACFKAIADAYLGAAPAAGRSLRFGLRRVPRLLALYLLYFLAIAVYAGVIGALAAGVDPWAALFVFFVSAVPVIYVLNTWMLSTPALLFEDVGPVRGMKRSWALVRGSWWRVVGIILVGVVLVSLVAGVLQGILVLVPAALADGNDVALALATVVAGTVSGVLTTPFTAAVIALVYFDQRVRREGFDLELLAQGLGERPPEAGSAAAQGYRPSEFTPEQRAQAPFWPPPPGWQPPPAAEPEPPPEPPPPPPGGWQPPTPQRWPPEPPERGSGGL